MSDAAPLADCVLAQSLAQSDSYIAALRAMNVPVRKVPFAGGTAWMMERCLPVLGSVGLVSRPPGIRDPFEAAQLRRSAQVDHVIVNADDTRSAAHLVDAGFRRIAQSRQIAVLDLDRTEKALRAGLSQKWRNRLRKGESGGVDVRQRCRRLPSDHWLFQADNAHARGKGFRPMPAKLTAAITQADPGAAHLFTAYHAGRRVAAALFFRHGARATYQIGWSGAEGRAVSAGNLVMWAAMRGLQDLGVAQIDLGHIDPARARGLTRFKLGTGARIHALGGTWLDSKLLPRRGSLRVSPLPIAANAPALAAPREFPSR